MISGWCAFHVSSTKGKLTYYGLSYIMPLSISLRAAYDNYIVKCNSSFTGSGDDGGGWRWEVRGRRGGGGSREDRRISSDMKAKNYFAVCPPKAKKQGLVSQTSLTISAFGWTMSFTAKKQWEVRENEFVILGKIFKAQNINGTTFADFNIIYQPHKRS